MAKFKVMNPDGSYQTITPPKPEPKPIKAKVNNEPVVMARKIAKPTPVTTTPEIVQPPVEKHEPPTIEVEPKVNEEPTVDKSIAIREPTMIEPEPIVHKKEEPKPEPKHEPKKVEINDSFGIIKPISRKSHKYDMEESPKKEEIKIPDGYYLVSKDDLNKMVETIVSTLSDTFVSRDHLSSEVEQALQKMVINNDLKE